MIREFLRWLWEQILYTPPYREGMIKEIEDEARK